MKFINPCKTCISRPVCRNECKDFVEFGVTTHDWLYLSWVITIILSSMFILTGFYMILPSVYVSITIFNLICFGYYKSIKEIILDIKEIKKHTVCQQIMLWSIGPLLMFASITWEKLPLDDPIDNFIYKYNKKVKTC